MSDAEIIDHGDEGQIKVNSHTELAHDVKGSATNGDVRAEINQESKHHDHHDAHVIAFLRVGVVQKTYKQYGNRGNGYEKFFILNSGYIGHQNTEGNAADGARNEGEFKYEEATDREVIVEYSHRK